MFTIPHGHPDTYERFNTTAGEPIRRRRLPLTSQLGAVSRRDPAETRSAAVERARAIYEELLTRKDTFQIPRGEIPMVEAMLERIKAQLKFLSRD